MTKKVIIASKNLVKINAVKIGFEKMFPSERFEFVGVSVPSGVENQPMDNKETITGAINRANNAKKQFQDAYYWVGIEGGIERTDDEMETFAWIVIKSNNVTGKARTGTFFLPNKIVGLINNGKELGDATEIVFKETNPKQKKGIVGILTRNVIVKTDHYVEAIILALIPFKNS